MPVPVEFTAEAVRAKSPREKRLFRDVQGTGEPYKSTWANDPWLRPPDTRKPLQWGPPPQYGTEHYWDTTVARKHEYWKDKDLPKPTKDMDQMRHDISTWGFCLIEDGLSQEQYVRMKQRLLEQAEGEVAAGIPHHTGTGQYVHGLVNKGECFVKCIEQDPEAVQAGPLIEQILNETLGGGWICNSFLANGCDPGGYPQMLHQDTNGDHGPFRGHFEAPTLFNTAYILEDTNEMNGGTILIPGSHRILAEAKNGPVGKLPPPINLEAKGGTVVMWDGRLLHGGGANRGSLRRYVCTASSVKPWFRTQEQWLLSVKPEVLAKASPKLLHRIGFQGAGSHGTVEGFGMSSSGRIGEMAGSLLAFREALEAGSYRRVTELSPRMSPEELRQDFTVRRSWAMAAAQQKEEREARRKAKEQASAKSKL